jgi:hypothetical protein
VAAIQTGNMQGVLEKQALILKKTTSLKQDNDNVQARMEELHPPCGGANCRDVTSNTYSQFLKHG